MSDRDSVENAVSGCDIVYHLAHDGKNLRMNIDGTKNIAEACVLHNVQRLVYTSSIAVYEPLPDGDLDESATPEYSGWEYADCKIWAENEVLRYAEERGLAATVLYPTIVYGPYGTRWTDFVAKELLSGEVYLPDGGQGLCNPVYVDDLADAIILAGESKAEAAEKFLISGPEPVPWADFYGAFEQVLGVQSQVHRPSEEIETLNRGMLQKIRLVIKDPLSVLSYAPFKWKPALNTIKFMRSKVSNKLVRKLQTSRLHIPDGELLALYKSRCHVRIYKAQRVLGYDPKFDFSKGMEETGRFLRWAYLGESLNNNTGIPPVSRW
jgi:nucleoside-diphosphate-sugar epimerase